MAVASAGPYASLHLAPYILMYVNTSFEIYKYNVRLVFSHCISQVLGLMLRQLIKQFVHSLAANSTRF